MIVESKPESAASGTADRLNVLFLLTSMPVGGAETLLLNLMRGFDARIRPVVGCLKEPGPLGEEIDGEFPIYSHLLQNKYDPWVLMRLRKVIRKEKIDVIVTVGAGDKMFWGRIAGWMFGVPVRLSALHSTGWPDGVGRLNRMLTPITNGFIAVAPSHGQFMVEHEKFPANKVHVIPNGIDTNRFQFSSIDRDRLRRSWGVGPEEKLVGIIAALRPEKNHQLFLQSAAELLKLLPQSRFLIVGDGPERSAVEHTIARLGLTEKVILAGSRSDVPEVLSALDIFSLTSDNEASPVSILEAMSVERVVVAPDVGSISDTIDDGQNGYLFGDRSAKSIAELWNKALENEKRAREIGREARRKVEQNASLENMVAGYATLMEDLVYDH